MASYHLSLKTVRRSEGRSATAAVAYRTAERIVCEREGRVHDYRAKAGVEAAFIVAPDGAPDWATDRQRLWNAAEARETRVNSVTAREWELALPHELDGPGRRALVEGFARELVARYRVAADVAIHAPHREGDRRNWHAHVLTTTRSLTAAGLTEKTRVLDAKQTGGPEVEHMRAAWAEMQNRALERAQVMARVDHRTLAVQRDEARRLGREAEADNLDRAPEVKMGPVVSGIERRERWAAEREGRAYVPVTERGAQVHEARTVRTLLAELGRVRDELLAQVRERAQAARESYAQAREDGADRVRAGLAALRAAAQRQGIGQGHARAGPEAGHDREDGHTREAARDRIRERLAGLREHGTGRGDERGAEAGRSGPAQGLEDMRERLGRILGRDEAGSHESGLEQLHETLGRGRAVEQEQGAHDRAREQRRPAHREHGHEHDDGWDYGL